MQQEGWAVRCQQHDRERRIRPQIETIESTPRLFQRTAVRQAHQDKASTRGLAITSWTASATEVPIYKAEGQPGFVDCDPGAAEIAIDGSDDPHSQEIRIIGPSAGLRMWRSSRLQNNW